MTVDWAGSGVNCWWFWSAKCPSFQCFFLPFFDCVPCYLIGCLGTENSMFFFSLSRLGDMTWFDPINHLDRFSPRLRDEMRQETFDERASKAPHLTSTAEAVHCEARDACPRRSHSIILIRCCFKGSDSNIPPLEINTGGAFCWIWWICFFFWILKKHSLISISLRWQRRNASKIPANLSFWTILLDFYQGPFFLHCKSCFFCLICLAAVVVSVSALSGKVCLRSGWLYLWPMRKKWLSTVKLLRPRVAIWCFSHTSHAQHP